MFLDEAPTWLEARLSSQATNILLTQNTNYQWRKRFLDVYLTFQDFWSIDKRFRMRFDTFIECEFREYNSREPFIYNYYRAKKHKKYYNKGRIYYTLKIPFDYMEKHIFHLYDTYEIVETLNKAKTIYNACRKNPSLMKNVLNNYYDILLPQIETDYNGKVTKENLELLLIDNEILQDYHKHLYNMLKNQKRLNLTKKAITSV
jgi:hypothetical protein